MSIKAQENRRVSRREFLRGLTVAGSAVALTACKPEVVKETVVVEKAVTATPAPREPITIIATSQMPLDIFHGSLERAKDLLPGVDLEVNQIILTGQHGWSYYADVVLTQIAGGEQLDVLMIAIEGMPLLASKNVFRDLDPIIAKDPDASALVEDVHPTLRAMLQYHGKQMELPFSWNNMVMHYNTKMFEEKGIAPPQRDWTWDDFLNISKQIANVKGTADDLYAYSFWGRGMYPMNAWLYLNGTGVFTDDWQDSNLLDPKVTQTIEWMADLILKHKVSPNPVGWDDRAQFHNGHMAMRSGGSWFIGEAMKDGFETYDVQWMPRRSGKLRSIAGTDGWGITSVSEHPDEAWQCVKLLGGREASLDMVKLGGNIPALRSVAMTPEFLDVGPANKSIFYDEELLSATGTVPSPPNVSIVEPLLDRYWIEIWSGERNIKEALRAAHEELQAEMDAIKPWSR